MSLQPLDPVRSAVACPFCGLACDDLVINTSKKTAKVDAKGCPRSVVMFDQASVSPDPDCLIAGRTASFDDAVQRSASLLRAASQPVIGGMAGDVAAVRAALALADRIGAVVDHMNAQALLRNIAVVQDSGWFATTFAEVQNRADLIILAGTDVVSRFPRFFERLLGERESMFADSLPARELVYIGAHGDALPWRADMRIDCADLGSAFAALRALAAGKSLQATEAGGVAIEQLRGLADRMLAAKYGVLVWVAADLDFPHAELTIQAMSSLVADLNEKTRFVVLPLGGNDGDLTANQVSLWQTGFPLRTSFGAGTALHDAYHYGAERLHAEGEADALLWISAFDSSRTPPSIKSPTIVLGHPAMRFATAPEVYIPVAVPGVHHAGHFFRSDAVVAVRLRQLLESTLPTAGHVIEQIQAAL